MGFIYSSLNRGADENRLQYDNRIARMFPFAAGAVYFDLRNYDAQTGEFGIYVEWDKELETVLGYALPAGGYFVKSTIAQAYRFHALDRGLPIYVKLIAQNGRLYLYRTYVMMEGRPFSVEFGGGALIPFEDRYEELGCEAAKQIVDAGSRKLDAGSQRMFRGSQGFFTGSQRFRWNSSQMRLLFGSQVGFRYLTGSQYRMFGSQYRTTGSQRMFTGSQRFRWNGSQMWLLFGSQYRIFGSQRMFTGSQHGMFGSQRMMMGSPYRMTGSQRGKRSICQPLNRADSVRISQELMAEFPQEWQLINRSRRPASRIGGNAKFGYGLDLI